MKVTGLICAVFVLIGVVGVLGRSSISMADNAVEARRTARFGSAEFIPTPTGMRHRHCVLEVPHRSIAVEHPTKNDTLLVRVLGDDMVTVVREIEYEAPAHCREECAAISKRAVQKRKLLQRPDFAPEDTNGWLDYGGYYLDKANVPLTYFSSDMSVPPTPKKTADQVLFWFPGSQDNDDPTSVTILQPVLTYNQPANIWSAANWNCCPAGITTTSPNLEGFKPGDTLQGIIQRNPANPDQYTIDCSWNVEKNGTLTTTLVTPVSTNLYNWIDITLEVYNVASCDELSGGEVKFSNNVIQGADGTKITPQWSFTQPTLCGGSITQDANGDVVIKHTQA